MSLLTKFNCQLFIGINYAIPELMMSTQLIFQTRNSTTLKVESATKTLIDSQTQDCGKKH